MSCFITRGTGTSFHDLATHGFGIDVRTGAIVPSDLRKGSPREVLDGLIIGARDLRPRFTQLEQKGAVVTVLFDSCYSGDAARSLPALVARDADLFARSTEVIQREFDQRLGELLAQSGTRAEDDWPYSGVVYISAAARHEKAWDIPGTAIRTGLRQTLDGLAHGAFTNGLLEGLEGAADLNHDGVITYRELHGFLMQRVQTQNGQTPQLFPRAAALVNEPVFGSVAAKFARDGAKQDTVLRVKLDADAPGLSAKLGQERNLLLSTRDYDVRVVRAGSALGLEHVSGGRIGQGGLNEEGVLRLLQRLAQAQKVVGVRYPSQDFNVALSIERIVSRSGVEAAETATTFQERDRIRIGITPDQAAYLLALDVDVEGSVTLLYPVTAANLAAVRAGTNSRGGRFDGGLSLRDRDDQGVRISQ